MKRMGGKAGQAGKRRGEGERRRKSVISRLTDKVVGAKPLGGPHLGLGADLREHTHTHTRRYRSALNIAEKKAAPKKYLRKF